MATKYARAAGGNWSADATWSLSSGGAADTVAPTAADNVILDAASGNVTIDSGGTRLGRSLDCTGYTGTLTHNSATVLELGDATAGTGNVILKFVAGMTYSRGASSSQINFYSTNATAQTVTTAGKTLGYTQVGVSATSNIQLADAWTSISEIWHILGTFDTNGQTLSTTALRISGSATRTLTFGSSAITLSSPTPWIATTVTGLTVTANTATVTCSAAAAVFDSGAQNWNGLSVVMSGSGAAAVTATGAFTVANLTRTGTAVKTDSLTISGPFTVTGTFTATGNSATNRLLVASTTLGTARTITAAAVSLTNVDFRDITGAGAATWSGTSIGNALGNTGITFTTPVTRYAVATGNVSGTGTWSATSGGASGASVPLCHDTMILDAASGAITVTNDMPRLCADLICTGFTGTLTLTTAPEIYGSVTLASGMTLSGTGAVTLRGRSSHTITSAGKTWLGEIIFTIGTYTLADAFVSTWAGFSITLTGGTFNDGGFSTTIATALVTTGGTLTMSGTTTITGSYLAPWTVSGSTVNHTGTIILSAATATDRTFAGGGKTYGTLTDQNTSTGKLTITGANTFGTINKTAAAACTLALPTSSGITITGLFNVNGASGAVLTLTGDVTKAEGTVSCDYLAISSSDAAGGATFYAGANSTDGGTNTGWIFGAPSGLSAPYAGGAYVTGALNSEPAVEGALVVT